MNICYEALIFHHIIAACTVSSGQSPKLLTDKNSLIAFKMLTTVLLQTLATFAMIEGKCIDFSIFYCYESLQYAEI